MPRLFPSLMALRSKVDENLEAICLGDKRLCATIWSEWCVYYLIHALDPSFSKLRGTEYYLPMHVELFSFVECDKNV